MNKYLKNLNSRWIKLSLIIIGAIFLLARAPYGYCFDDEPFIIGLAERLFKGDSLYINEYHYAQNIGILLLPFYSIFRLLNNNNVGILLYFRYIYCVIWFLTSAFLFITLEKLNYKYVSIVAFLVMIFYSPLDYMTMSYTSISLVCIISLSCLIALYRRDLIPGTLFYVLSPLLILISVLAYPNAAIIVVVGYICSIYVGVKNNNKKIIKYWNNSFIFYILVFIIYLFVFVFKDKYDIQHFILSINAMLTIFSERNWTTYFIELVKIIFTSFPLLIATSIISIFYHKVTKKNRNIIITILCISYILDQFLYCKYNLLNFNEQMYGFGILSVPLWYLSKKEKYDTKTVFLVMGLLYSFVCYFGSDTKIMAISHGLSINCISSLLCIHDFCLEDKRKSTTIGLNLMKYVVIFTVFIQLSSEIAIRSIRTYYDDNLPELSNSINMGSAKGLRTSKKLQSKYVNEYLQLQELLKQSEAMEGNFLAGTFNPIDYLDANLEYGTYSAWTYEFSIKKHTKIEDDYYKLNPNKNPDFVFYNDNQEQTIDSSIFSDYELFIYKDSKLLKRKKYE